MNIQFSKRTALLLAATLPTLLLAGCSFFSSKPDGQATGQPGFRAVASADAMPVPLPIEIADDIKKIANGQPVQSSDGWQATNPDGTPVAGAPGENSDQALFSAPGSEAADAAPRRVGKGGAGKGSGNGKDQKYVVKTGDTLMKISFEKYGNVYRWREILNANKGKIANFNSLPIGATLVIKGVEYVVIERNGQPYLIRRGDTLVKISRGLYNTPVHWKDLWMNNRQLIRDPNKIYAGFTLYYQDLTSNPNQGPKQLLGRKSPRNGAGPAPRVPASKKPAALPPKAAPAPEKAPAPAVEAAPAAPSAPAEASAPVVGPAPVEMPTTPTETQTN